MKLNIKSKTKCSLYRYKYVSEHGGYIVYRRWWYDENEPNLSILLTGIRDHKDAIFVEECAAKFYCHIRNLMTVKKGSDALPREFLNV